jgi:hypothetical protein
MDLIQRFSRYRARFGAAWRVLLIDAERAPERDAQFLGADARKPQLANDADLWTAAVAIEGRAVEDAERHVDDVFVAAGGDGAVREKDQDVIRISGGFGPRGGRQFYFL